MFSAIRGCFPGAGLPPIPGPPAQPLQQRGAGGAGGAPNVIIRGLPLPQRVDATQCNPTQASHGKVCLVIPELTDKLDKAPISKRRCATSKRLSNYLSQIQ